MPNEYKISFYLPYNSNATNTGFVNMYKPENLRKSVARTVEPQINKEELDKLPDTEFTTNLKERIKKLKEQLDVMAKQLGSLKEKQLQTDRSLSRFHNNYLHALTQTTGTRDENKRKVETDSSIAMNIMASHEQARHNKEIAKALSRRMNKQSKEIERVTLRNKLSTTFLKTLSNKLYKYRQVQDKLIKEAELRKKEEEKLKKEEPVSPSVSNLLQSLADKKAAVEK